MVRHRDRALTAVLEAEREQGWPAPFDWKAWRRNRGDWVVAMRVERARDDRVARRLPDLPPARVIHRVGTSEDTGLRV